MHYSIPFVSLLTFCLLLLVGCRHAQPIHKQPGEKGLLQDELTVEFTEATGSFRIKDVKENRLLLTQQAQENTRPYIHPIAAPDGKGVLTQFSPDHHKHQTGLYWGLKEVNGRDYFMNWKDNYWQKVSEAVVQATGNQVKWKTVYHLLDANKQPLLTETQTWAMQQQHGQYILDLEWKGEAKMDVQIAKFYVGGLFLRMPWYKGIHGEVMNAAGQRNQEAEGQRAIWTDIGIQVEGRNDLAHIAIFDHPENAAFPTPWRVDNELGIGPSRQILGDWKIEKGKSAVFRYRLVVYTGVLNSTELTRQWKAYSCEE
ncbi:PmoA family protein [Rhodocytophaga aerolata]|uniref:PmoA family protein n=1 Tax=Rhodocytophaga aerolata TaxID=455078 RepID=A0ABT8RFT4_9BACT|nr:DUF6807 family protein [Rhodocytophaga aerolata]MDO1450963.1 PmoA family protein [Rhodocytophaga aerolata]